MERWNARNRDGDEPARKAGSTRTKDTRRGETARHRWCCTLGWGRQSHGCGGDLTGSRLTQEEPCTSDQPILVTGALRQMTMIFSLQHNLLEGNRWECEHQMAQSIPNPPRSIRPWQRRTPLTPDGQRKVIYAAFSRHVTSYSASHTDLNFDLGG